MNKLNFSTLFSGGGYSLPVLVELKNPKSANNWYFTNNDTDINWDGNRYISVPMSYKPPSSQDGVPSNGTLEILVDIQDNNEELLKWFDTADDKVSANVVAIINKNGVIESIGQLHYQHGTVTWDGRKIVWNIGWDDRLNMQINPWSFTAKALLD